MNYKLGKKGFSFVEAMIVLVIMVLLIIMAIPAFNKLHRISQEREVKENLNEFVIVARQYMDDNEVAKVSYEDLVEAGLIGLEQVSDEDYTTLTLGSRTNRLTVMLDGHEVAYDF